MDCLKRNKQNRGAVRVKLKRPRFSPVYCFGVVSPNSARAARSLMGLGRNASRIRSRIASSLDCLGLSVWLSVMVTPLV